MSLFFIIHLIFVLVTVLATELSDIVHAGFVQVLKVVGFDPFHASTGTASRKAVKCWESRHLWQSRAD